MRATPRPAHAVRTPDLAEAGFVGTRGATARSMAAVMALVFLFVVASIGSMIKSVAAISFGSVLAVMCFVALAVGVFVGAFVQAKHWEDEA